MPRLSHHYQNDFGIKDGRLQGTQTIRTYDATGKQIGDPYVTRWE